MFIYKYQVMIFFSAHGVPRAYVEEAGDPYKDEMEHCIKLIMIELRLRGVPNDHTLAYQVCCQIYEGIGSLRKPPRYGHTINMSWVHLILF